MPRIERDDNYEYGDFSDDILSHIDADDFEEYLDGFLDQVEAEELHAQLEYDETESIEVNENLVHHPLRLFITEHPAYASSID